MIRKNKQCLYFQIVGKIVHTWGNGDYCLQVKVNSLDWKRRKIPLSQAGEGGWADTENESY